MPFQALIHAAQQTEIMVCPKLHKEHLVWKISQNIQEVKCENCCAVTILSRQLTFYEDDTKPKN